MMMAVVVIVLPIIFYSDYCMYYGPNDVYRGDD